MRVEIESTGKVITRGGGGGNNWGEKFDSDALTSVDCGRAYSGLLKKQMPLVSWRSDSDLMN